MKKTIAVLAVIAAAILTTFFGIRAYKHHDVETSAVTQDAALSNAPSSEPSNAPSSAPSRYDFENLDKDLSFEEIIERFGACSYEGSGIIYHVWILDDGSKAKLVFNSKGKIEFIYIVTDDSSERVTLTR